MRKRWVKLCLAIGLPVILIFVACIALGHRDNGSELVNEETFNRVESGMTVDEVDSMLGRPAEIRSYTRDDGVQTRVYVGRRNGEYRPQASVIFVNGRATDTDFLEKLCPTLLTRFMDWLEEKFH